MEDFDSSARDILFAHRSQEFAPSCGERVARLVANVLFQFGARGQRRTVFMNESPERRSISFVSNPSGEQCEMNVAARFIPRSKCASSDVFFDTFRRAPEPGVFPIVNRA